MIQIAGRRKICESAESLAAVGSDASAPPRQIQGEPLHKLIQADKPIQAADHSPAPAN
jgi:hypothetical protein